MRELLCSWTIYLQMQRKFIDLKFIIIIWHGNITEPIVTHKVILRKVPMLLRSHWSWISNDWEVTEILFNQVKTMSVTKGVYGNSCSRTNAVCQLQHMRYDPGSQCTHYTSLNTAKLRWFVHIFNSVFILKTRAISFPTWRESWWHFA